METFVCSTYEISSTCVDYVVYQSNIARWLHVCAIVRFILLFTAHPLIAL